MEARNRKLEDWYGKIKRSEIKLPRFQRYEVWRSLDSQNLLLDWRCLFSYNINVVGAERGALNEK